MTIENIILFLENPDSYWSSRSYMQIENEFEIKPEDFLNYAEKDLESEYDHKLINALSNAKRSLDCQVDILLMAFGYYSISKRKKWGFPKKIEIIKELGILAPRVLLKLNKTRNLMEHHFAKPTNEQVEDFVDIVGLFIGSTDKYIYNFPDDLEIENNSQEQDFWLTIQNDYKNEQIIINICNKEVPNNSISFTSNDEQYPRLLKSILNIGNQH